MVYAFRLSSLFRTIISNRAQQLGNCFSLTPECNIEKTQLQFILQARWWSSRGRQQFCITTCVGRRRDDDKLDRIDGTILLLLFGRQKEKINLLFSFCGSKRNNTRYGNGAELRNKVRSKTVIITSLAATVFHFNGGRTRTVRYT